MMDYWFPNEAIKWARIYLDSLGVRLLIGEEFSIIEIRSDSVRLKNGSEIKKVIPKNLEQKIRDNF